MSEPEYPRHEWVAAAKRDAGLRRIATVTRRVFFGALAATGVFAAISAHSFAGKASGATTASTGPSSSPADPASPPTTQPPSDDTQPYYLQPPQQVPQPSYGYGHVRSGGS
ncbi:MAG: hypothetical protein JOZ04_10865 [Acidimicrobiia bacterium]|nr:hypothetical protein [Acidimicrobiia bacterium]